MEALDLSIHDRDEYEGKFFDCNGCRYIVGEFIGSGVERIVHRAINERSSLSLLVVKILKWARPRGEYTRTLSVLRASTKLAPVITVTVECEVPGGLVELQRNAMSPLEGDRAAEHVRAGFDALKEDPVDARRCFETALHINPAHSAALYGLAHALWRADDTAAASQAIESAVQIEPNILDSWDTYIRLAAVRGLTAQALQLYRRASKLFEHVHDLDELGATLYLQAGDPEAARNCVATAIVTDEQRESLVKDVDAAAAVRESALALAATARPHVMAGEWATAAHILLDAQRRYNADPALTMNAGFATARGGDPEVAAALLIHATSVVRDAFLPVCLLNASFAMIAAGHAERAMNNLDVTARVLTSLYGEVPDNQIDLPSVGLWTEGDELVSEPVSAASAILAGAVAAADADGRSVPERVRDLAAKFRHATVTAV
jgi:hypothetical protein